jgi:hypothetical protein
MQEFHRHGGVPGQPPHGELAFYRLAGGLSISQIAWAYLPVMVAWAWGAWRLGRMYADLAQQRSGKPEAQAAPTG